MRKRWGRTRAPRFMTLVIALVALDAAFAPSMAFAAGPSGSGLKAYLDGRPLKLTEVADWYCDDFSYPVIQCYSEQKDLVARDAAVLSVTAVDYVTIYDQPTYAGSFMQVSQDYSVLATIGWNDRVSSFKARNSLNGHFYTDWFYGGTSYSFCCNQQAASLGSFDNTFSSVHQG
jgi:hypothetical protein